MSALVVLSASSQAILTACVNDHMNSSSAWMTKYAEIFSADKAITHAHALAVGLKGTTKAGEAFGGYIKSVCSKIDVDDLNALFLGANYHRITVLADKDAMVAELKRVAKLVEQEDKDEADKNNLNGTATFEAIEAVQKAVAKARKLPMVQTTKADTAFLTLQADFDALKEQYLGKVETPMESEKELSTK
jgi:hypothetical protein